MIVIGIDPGSGKCGIVAAIDGRPVVSATLIVDPANVGPTAAEIERAIVESGAELVIVEGSRAWGGSRTPQEEAARTEAAKVMARLDERILMVCEARKIERRVIAVQSWRSRIGVKKPKPAEGETVPHSWADSAVKARLTILLGDHATLLRDVHQRDAMGVLLGGTLPAPEKPKAKRSAGPRVKGRRTPRAGPETPCRACGVAWQAHPMADVAGHPYQRQRPKPAGKLGRDATEAARLAAGCTCGSRKGRHLRTCPVHIGRQARQIAPALARSWLQ